MKTHVYFMDLPSPKKEKIAQVKYLAQNCVTGERREKLDKLKSDKAVLQSAGGILLLDFARKQVAEKPDLPMEIGYRENGKPYFLRDSWLYFNISHTDDCVMCIVSDREIGCDIEKKKEANLQVAKRFFHPDEYKRVADASNQEMADREFLRIWTRKESFLKTIGVGLRRPLDNFCVLPDIFSDPEEKQDVFYGFKEFLFTEYCAAICMQQKNEQALPQVFYSFQNLEDMVY